MTEEPKRKTYLGLIERFGSGWEHGKTDWITEICCDDVVFIPDPFAQPLVGVRAVERYWRDVPQEQAEISFRAGEIFVAGPWFSTEFRCTFRRRRTGERMDLRGALFCETRDGKISEMRMYWDRAVIPGRNG
ncbi:MAG: nuclear transport factor 2 family protein [Gemmatimonadales bacterium]